MTEKNKANGTKKKSLTKTSEDKLNVTQQLETIKQNTFDTLAKYDRERAVAAEGEGHEAPESLSEVWEEACRQTDTNEMLRTNLMQMQVLFQEMFRDLFGDINLAEKESKELIATLKGSHDDADWDRYKELRDIVKKERAEMIKRIESMSKTIKQLQSEYRAGEMAKAQHYHISEVRAQQMFIIAIMRQMITDQTLLNAISEALIVGWQQMGSFSQKEEYKG